MTWAPSVKQLSIMQQGRSAPFPNVCEWQDAVYCPANAAQSFDVTAFRAAASLAAGAPFFLILSADNNFWMHAHATATIPGSSTTDGTASDFSPSQFYVAADVTSLSFIASVITRVVLKIFKT